MVMVLSLGNLRRGLGSSYFDFMSSFSSSLLNLLILLLAFSMISSLFIILPAFLWMTLRESSNSLLFSLGENYLLMDKLFSFLGETDSVICLDIKGDILSAGLSSTS